MFLKYQRLTAILHTNAVQESYDEIQMIKNRTVAPIGLNTLKTIGGSNELLRFFMINSKNMHIFFKDHVPQNCNSVTSVKCKTSMT